MPAADAIIGGLNAGTKLAELKQQQRRDAFDQQQAKLANYESIVGDAEKSLQRFQQEMAIKRAAATSPEGQKLIDDQYAQLYKSVITPISRAGEKAFQQGIPVDTPVQLARLLPYQQLPDLNAQAVVAAQAAGGVKAAETQGALPGKKEFDTFQTDNDIRLAQERGRQSQITAAVPRRERIINEAPDELAPPQIGQIYGIENATVGDLKRANIFLPEDNKTLREIIPANAAYRGLVKSGTSALEVMQNNPDVAPIGDIVEFGENVKAQAVSLARQIGFDVADVDLDSAVIQTEVEKIAGANRELRATMISMAYASAIAKGQTGQGLSDKDVANEVKQLGGDARTPEGMQRAMMAFMDRTETDYRTRIANTLNQPPPKSAYSMTSEELVQMIEQAGGFENLPEQDQRVVRARAKFLEQREQ